MTVNDGFSQAKACATTLSKPTARNVETDGFRIGGTHHGRSVVINVTQALARIR
jgi:hypothetical protein